jgi:hypothetical protein
MTTEQDRLEQLERCIPDIWDHKTYLYVGANEERFHFKEQLKAVWIKGSVIDVVEVSPERAEFLKWTPFVRHSLVYDIADFAEECPIHYDVIIWSHGPTCLAGPNEAIEVITNLERNCELLVLMCPWGKYPENDPSKHLYDINKFSMYPEAFENFGFNVSVIGEPDTAGSNILAWTKR